MYLCPLQASTPPQLRFTGTVGNTDSPAALRTSRTDRPVPQTSRLITLNIWGAEVPGKVVTDWGRRGVWRRRACVGGVIGRAGGVGAGARPSGRPARSWRGWDAVCQGLSRWCRGTAARVRACAPLRAPCAAGACLIALAGERAAKARRPRAAIPPQERASMPSPGDPAGGGCGGVPRLRRRGAGVYRSANRVVAARGVVRRSRSVRREVTAPPLPWVQPEQQTPPPSVTRHVAASRQRVR
jgi:hypothetical protein